MLTSELESQAMILAKTMAINVTIRELNSVTNFALESSWNLLHILIQRLQLALLTSHTQIRIKHATIILANN